MCAAPYGCYQSREGLAWPAVDSLRTIHECAPPGNKLDTHTHAHAHTCAPALAPPTCWPGPACAAVSAPAPRSGAWPQRTGLGRRCGRAELQALQPQSTRRGGGGNSHLRRACGDGWGAITAPPLPLPPMTSAPLSNFFSHPLPQLCLHSACAYAMMREQVSLTNTCIRTHTSLCAQIWGNQPSSPNSSLTKFVLATPLAWQT